MISALARPRTLRVAGLAAGAVAIAGAAVYVTASAAGYNFNFGGPSSPTSSAGLTSAPQGTDGASAACADFIDHFAADLGSDQSKVDAAFQQALSQTLADEVKAGKLTQQQADAIKARLADKRPCSFVTLPKTGKATTAMYTQQVLAAAASALDVTPTQLRTDLKNGMSLSQIAAAHNPPLTEEQFRAKLIASLKAMLDELVARGSLTSQQEQQILQRLQTGSIPFWADAPRMPQQPRASPLAYPSPSPNM